MWFLDGALCVLGNRCLSWSLKNDTLKSPTGIWKTFWKPQMLTKNRRSLSWTGFTLKLLRWVNVEICVHITEASSLADSLNKYCEKNYPLIIYHTRFSPRPPKRTTCGPISCLSLVPTTWMAQTVMETTFGLSSLLQTWQRWPWLRKFVKCRYRNMNYPSNMCTKKPHKVF